jgi:hypothetical protein
MSTTTSLTEVNFFDVLKMKGADGSVLEVAEVLNEVSDVMRLMPNRPANGGRFHEGLRDTSLPGCELSSIGASWGEYKGTEEKFVEGLCMIRTSFSVRSDVLANEGPQYGMATIQHKKRQTMEAVNQAFNNLLLKGVTTPDQLSVVGLEKRAPWNAIDSEFCFDLGGSGDNKRSAWLMAPGPATCFLLHNPIHPTLGIKYEEKPEAYMVDADSTTKHYYKIPHEFEFQGGICIKDQRAVKRLANIDAAVTDSGGIDVVRLAIRASMKHSLLANEQWILFCDGDLYSMLVAASNDVTKVYTNAKNIWNTDLPSIGTGKGSIVIARWDSLNYATGSGESAVS